MYFAAQEGEELYEIAVCLVEGIPAVSLVTDHYTLRTEAERIVGEDRVPTGVLKRHMTDYGGVEFASRASRESWLGHRAAMLFALAVRGLTDRHPIEAPVSLPLDGAEAIEALFKAAYDSELTTLDELVERRQLGVEVPGQGGGLPLPLHERRHRGLRRLRCQPRPGKGGTRWMSSP